MNNALNVLPYQGQLPHIDAAPLVAQAGHALIGRIRMGQGAWLGAGTTIRADGHDVTIGEHFSMGRASTIHIAHDIYPTVVGQRVTVGANAVVHACTLHDDVVVEDDVVILDGSTIEAGVVLEAGSIVYPRSTLQAGTLYAGRPAKPVRPLAEGEAAQRAQAQAERNRAQSDLWQSQPTVTDKAATSFVAQTAQVTGHVQMAEDASIWYGCVLDAGDGTIALGQACNVQDGSVLHNRQGTLTIGAQSTIGHNVTLESCQVGARCLVGMGSRIAAGTVIGDDVFVAAGSTTEPGQVLEGGSFWGGSPARRMGTVDDAKRNIVQMTARVYAMYAQAMLHPEQPGA